MAHDHDDDPALSEALARRDESRAQILRSKAQGNSAYEGLANEAEKDAKRSSDAAAGIEPVQPDPEGTAQLLADSEGNFAANAEVAAAGGIGIKASNTDVSTGQPAQSPDQAGVAVADGAKVIVGDQASATASTSPTTETEATRAAVDIPASWRDLTWQERRSIASKLSDTPISNGDEANAAIEAELKRRGA